MTTAPDAYIEMIVIPAVLHTPWSVFREYPPAVQAATKVYLHSWLAAGQGMNLEVIRARS